MAHFQCPRAGTGKAGKFGGGQGAGGDKGPADGLGNGAAAIQIGKARADLAGGLMGDAGIHGGARGKDIA